MQEFKNIEVSQLLIVNDNREMAFKLNSTIYHLHKVVMCVLMLDLENGVSIIEFKIYSATEPKHSFGNDKK